MSIEKKIVVQKKTLELHSKEGWFLIWEFKVGIVMTMQVTTMELWKKNYALVSTNSLNSNFNDGFK